MRCSLNLHLRSAHEKPQQPNPFDSPTDSVLHLNAVITRYIVALSFTTLVFFDATICQDELLSMVTFFFKESIFKVKTYFYNSFLEAVIALYPMDLRGLKGARKINNALLTCIFRVFFNDLLQQEGCQFNYRNCATYRCL